MPRAAPHCVSVLSAWKRLLPGLYSWKLAEMFALVFPRSSLNGRHHVADVDCQKLAEMTWTLM